MDIKFPEVVSSRYKIISILGHGGMGDVYLAEDLQLPRRVAIKVIRKEFLNDEEIHRRIERESKLHAKIGTHSNIVTLYDIIRSDKGLYIVLEYVDGQTLAEIIKQNTKSGVRLSEKAVVDIVQQLLNALSKIHSSEVVHRDIKPDNLIVGTTDDGDYHVHLMDFGIAKADSIDDDETKLTKMGSRGPGTPSYMAPEQIDAFTYGDPSARTDIYSVGIIFYELMTGSTPFTGSLTEVYSAHLIKDVQNVTNTDRLTNQWRSTICKALAKNQQERYATAKEFSASIQLVFEKNEASESSRSNSQDTDRTQIFHNTNNKTRLAIGNDLADLLASSSIGHNLAEDEVTKFSDSRISPDLELPTRKDQPPPSVVQSFLHWFSKFKWDKVLAKPALYTLGGLSIASIATILLVSKPELSQTKTSQANEAANFGDVVNSNIKTHAIDSNDFRSVFDPSFNPDTPSIAPSSSNSSNKTIRDFEEKRRMELAKTRSAENKPKMKPVTNQNTVNPVLVPTVAVSKPIPVVTPSASTNSTNTYDFKVKKLESIKHD